MEKARSLGTEFALFREFLIIQFPLWIFRIERYVIKPPNFQKKSVFYFLDVKYPLLLRG